MVIEFQTGMNGGFYHSALLLMQFWQLHMQHVLIMTLHHNVIYSIQAP